MKSTLRSIAVLSLFFACWTMCPQMAKAQDEPPTLTVSAGPTSIAAGQSVTVQVSFGDFAYGNISCTDNNNHGVGAGSTAHFSFNWTPTSTGTNYVTCQFTGDVYYFYGDDYTLLPYSAYGTSNTVTVH